MRSKSVIMADIALGDKTLEEEKETSLQNFNIVLLLEVLLDMRGILNDIKENTAP